RPEGRRCALLRLEELELRLAPAASVSIGDASLPGGGSGSAVMSFTGTPSDDLCPQGAVGYTPSGGSAPAGAEYVAQAGNLVIPAGATSATIGVPVLGNLLDQPDRTFSVQLTGIVDVSTPASFGTQQSFGTGENPFSVAVGDFNGDGKLDLAVANGGF